MKRAYFGRFGIYAPLLTILTVIATTLRTVAVFLGVDDYGFFASSTLATVSAWVAVSGILIALTYPLIHKKERTLYRDDRTPLTYVSAAALGLGVFLFGAEIAPKAMLLFSLVRIDAQTVTATLLLLLSAATVLFSGAVCLIESRRSDTRAGLGMLAVLLFGVYAAFLYYDTTLPLNAPIKVTDQMAYLCYALFFLYEVRISLGREHEGLYTAFGFIAGTMAAYSAIPTLLYYIINGKLLSYCVTQTILSICVLTFVLCRLLVRDSSPEDRPVPLIGELIRVAERRTEARAEATNRAESHEEPITESEEPIEEQIPPEDSDDEDTDTQQITIDLTDELLELSPMPAEAYTEYEDPTAYFTAYEPTDAVAPEQLDAPPIPKTDREADIPKENEQ